MTYNFGNAYDERNFVLVGKFREIVGISDWVEGATLVRGWCWNTTDDLLERADRARKSLGITKTQMLEEALLMLIEKVEKREPDNASLPD